MSENRTRIAVLFGGRSTEHEISIISALQAMDAFDATRYEVIPVYIDPDGEWWTGDLLRERSSFLLTAERKEACTQVSLKAEPGSVLYPVEPKRSWFFSSPQPPIPVDVFVPVFHGSFGEDGCIQGVLETIGAAYTGCGVRCSSIGMNKHLSKKVAAQAGIPVLGDTMLSLAQWDPNRSHEIAAEVQDTIPLPVMVKPCNLGSSIAISAAHTEEELMVSLAGAFSFDTQVIVEPLIDPMYELNVSVLGGSELRTSAIERPRRDNPLLTFEDKYMKGGKGKKSASYSEGMASLDRDINPEDVDPAVMKIVRGYSRGLFEAMGCSGVVRFDYLVDANENKVVFNEINTMPGSFSYYLWEHADPKLSFTELLSIITTNAIEDWRIRRRVNRNLSPRLFQA